MLRRSIRDPAGYDSAAAVPNGTALVFVTRGGQEGSDIKADAFADGTPHYLALTEAEKGTIAAAKKLCKNTVLIVNSAAPMELSPAVSGEYECDAILWVAHPGNYGFAALPKLLTGEYNPSGRTVDIWTADFTADPSYQAIGDHRYTNYKVTNLSICPQPPVVILSQDGRVILFSRKFLRVYRKSYPEQKHYQPVQIRTRRRASGFVQSVHIGIERA